MWVSGGKGLMQFCENFRFNLRFYKTMRFAVFMHFDKTRRSITVLTLLFLA